MIAMLPRSVSIVTSSFWPAAPAGGWDVGQPGGLLVRGDGAVPEPAATCEAPLDADGATEATTAAPEPPRPPGRRTRNATITTTMAAPAHVSGFLSHPEPDDPRVALPPRTPPVWTALAARARSASYRRRRSPSRSQWRAMLSRFWRAVDPPR